MFRRSTAPWGASIGGGRQALRPAPKDEAGSTQATEESEMKSMFTLLGGAALGFALISLPPGASAEGVIRGNIRVVVGSTSTGADTYQNAAIVADALAKQLGINAKVDPIGATESFKAIARDTTGNTIMFFHDQSYLGHLYGVRGYEDIFAKYKIGPTVSVNPGNCFLVSKKSSYQTMDDIIAAAGKGTRIRVAVERGGVSEIGFSAIKNAVRVKHPGNERNIVAINTGSQADKNQLLFDGQADVIHCSVQANEQYTRLPADDQKAMRFVWLTSSKLILTQANPKGLGETSRDELLKYAEPSVVVPVDASGKTFTFDKDFFFLYGATIDPKAVTEIDKALANVYGAGNIQTALKNAFFIPNFKPSYEAESYLKAKNNLYKQVIDAIKE
jgi:tripartite-type tricarboxylate transporter receptor subunit TctC